ncbi:hypothetical protein ACHQM5_006109 [Ranunculus cassubicifolius]
MIDRAVQNRDLANETIGPLANSGFGRSPFTADIKNAVHSKDFKLPELSKYRDVDGDPFLHLQEFETRLILSQNDEPLLCKLFPGTLQGEALRW